MKGCDDKDLIRPLGPTVGGRTVVQRHRPGHTTELAVVQKSQDGRPMSPGEEHVTTRPRGDGTFEIVASYVHGPAQVATADYRDGWERTFNAPGGSA
jgi:hypothetical protein